MQGQHSHSPLLSVDSSSPPSSSLEIRRGTIADIPFLARIEYEASLPPFNQCFWEELLQGTSTSSLSFIAAMLQADAGNWGKVSEFLILEEQGNPVAAAAGYQPNPEDYCPLNLARLEQIAQLLDWSPTTTAEFRDRYSQFWGGDLQPAFLMPQTPWVIENVAVLPEARGRGLGQVVVRALLEEGRSQHQSHVGIMVINGNDRARRTYEAIGFKPYLTVFADYFLDLYNLEFPGVTKLGVCLLSSGES